MLIIPNDLNPILKCAFCCFPAGLSRGRLLPSVFVERNESHLVRRWPSETHSRKFRTRKHRQTQSQISLRLAVPWSKFNPYRTKTKIISRVKRTSCKNIDKHSLKTCKTRRDQNGPNGALVLASCFVLRLSRKAKLGQKVVRFDPTMVSLSLDACRAKCTWSFDRLACLTCSFAPARRLSHEMHCRHRQGRKTRLRPTVKCAPARRPSIQMSFRSVEIRFYAMPADPNALPMC